MRESTPRTERLALLLCGNDPSPTPAPRAATACHADRADRAVDAQQTIHSIAGAMAASCWSPLGHPA